jgi:hypothetical protein
MLARVRILVLLIISLQGLNVAAQTISVAGKVTNVRNEPLVGANITLQNGSTRNLTTDVEGKFYVNLEVGKKYSIKVTNTGYEGKEIADIEVKANQENIIEIVLIEKATSNLQAVTITSSSRRQENTSALLSFQRSNMALSSGLEYR